MSEQKKCALSGCNKNARRKFCSNKHKDRYHNLTNPRGIYSHLADDESVHEEACAAMEEGWDGHKNAL